MKKKNPRRDKSPGLFAAINHNIYTLAQYLESYATALRNASEKSATMVD